MFSCVMRWLPLVFLESRLLAGGSLAGIASWRVVLRMFGAGLFRPGMLGAGRLATVVVAAGVLLGTGPLMGEGLAGARAGLVWGGMVGWVQEKAVQGVAVQEKAVRPEGPVLLFNGKNLDGWTTWLKEYRYEDPHGVFRVVDGQIRISGQDWGGMTTRGRYRDYHLIVEWRWGGKTWPPREEKARDSGILVHAVGEDGLYNPTWLESIESQMIEGGTGDFLMVAGEHKPRLTARLREEGRELYWHPEGTEQTRDSGRFNWWGRARDWKDAVGFRGPADVEMPVGEWNRHEVIADGDALYCVLNGKLVNFAYGSSHREGKIQIQSEGAEIWIRRVELRPVGKKPVMPPLKSE